jgi:hypothetical protein
MGRGVILAAALILAGCVDTHKSEVFARCQIGAMVLHVDKANAERAGNARDQYILTCMAAHGYEYKAAQSGLINVATSYQRADLLWLSRLFGGG